MTDGCLIGQSMRVYTAAYTTPLQWCSVCRPRSGSVMAEATPQVSNEVAEYVTQGCTWFPVGGTMDVSMISILYTLANPSTSFLQSEHPTYNLIRLYALNQRL